MNSADFMRWLNKFYQNPVDIYRDTTNLLNFNQGLALEKDDYTFTDGTMKELINLAGTITTYYKGSPYNVPICVWLLPSYPNDAPISYVKPTSNMCLGVSKFVDPNGRISLPYLDDWIPYKSDLFGLIQVMIATFGETPAVFFKPKSDNSSHVAVAPEATPRTIPATASTSHSRDDTIQMPIPSNPAAIYSPHQYPNPTLPHSAVGNLGPVILPLPQEDATKYEQLRVHLTNAIEDISSKLSRMNEHVQRVQEEVQSLTKKHEEFEDGKVTLKSMFNTMKKEKDDLDRSLSSLKDTEQELKTAIETMKNKDSHNKI
ncbi:hypothetical protein GWI33_020510 [Rhynchophorus ferrugineus]|uniref:UEV domain-containing protein n=1 Tax=Rhynchophorus ferrugineus TaxID=354439 RepID=A0A834HWB2_RHYFE|nr:hypothetical protein GWI33_020510 [Rhynchophorus ferrugineus]